MGCSSLSSECFDVVRESELISGSLVLARWRSHQWQTDGRQSVESCFIGSPDGIVIDEQSYEEMNIDFLLCQNHSGSQASPVMLSVFD